MTTLFSELLENELTTDTNYNDICLISLEPLDNIHVTLPCSHKYNYYAIYRETVSQRKTIRHSSPKIQCPYCRKKHTCVLPYMKLPGVEYIKWVNYPVKYQLLPNKCAYVFKNNPSKRCNKACMNNMCQYHTKIIAGSTISDEEMKSINSSSDMSSYTITTLRLIARFKKLKKYSTLKKQDLLALIQESLE